MLDTFLKVAYDQTTRHTENVKLAKVLKDLPMEDLRKLATGEAKLAFDDVPCSDGAGEDKTWLGKYKGTPLFEQALALEKAELEAEVAQTAQREQERASDSLYRTRDNIRLQKKMLDLDLVSEQNGGTPNGPDQPMKVVPNGEAQGAGAPGDTGTDDGPQKLSFAVTEEGHKFDAALNEMRVRHAAEQQALRDHFTGGRFGLTDEARQHIADQGGYQPAGGIERMGRLLRFAPGRLHENDMGARHDNYTAKKHQAGENAYNPFGGMLTPVDAEVGADRAGLGSYKSDAPEHKKLKKAAARFAKAAAALDLKGLGGAALSIAKKNPKLVGAGLGAVGGAIAGGPDHRLSGALGGAALGHTAGGVGGHMLAGKTLGQAASAHGADLKQLGASLRDRFQKNMGQAPAAPPTAG